MSKALKYAIVAACGLVWFASTPASAQMIKSWGVLGGITSSEHAWDPDNPFSGATVRKLSGHAGLYVEWLEVPYLSIVSQLAYVQKGVGLELVATDEEGHILGRRTYESHLNYLSVPVLLKVALPSRSLSPYLIAGPRLDVFVAPSGGTYLFRAVYDEFRHVAVGVTAGGGLQTGSMLPAVMFVEFRFNVDVTDSFPAGNPDLIPDRIRNSSFDVSLGIGVK